MLAYKIKTGLTPDYLTELFPNTVENTAPYDLRNAADFNVLNRRT